MSMEQLQAWRGPRGAATGVDEVTDQGSRRWLTTWWINAAGIVTVLAMFLGALLAVNRPAKRVERGLAALAAHDWESLQYASISMPHTAAYEPAASLFTAALKLENREFVAVYRNVRLASKDPTLQAAAWLLAGEALYAQNRFREAELNFNHAAELDPNLADAHRWLAIAYYDVGLMNQSLIHLKRVAEVDPQDPRSHRLMGLIHMDRGAFAIAIEDYHDSLRRDQSQPDQQEILAELAACQLGVNRYEDAQQTLASADQTAEVLAMRAEARYALGDRPEAKQLAESALKTGPHLRLALSVLGKIALDERRFDDAIGFLTRGTQVAPSDYDMRYSLVTALRAAGKKDAAEQELAAAESLRKLRDQYDELIELASTTPYDAEVRYQLGLLADRIGLPDIARTWMRAAVTLDPRHALAAAELKKRGTSSQNAATMLRGG